jgi:hypothetical protein
LAVDSFGTRRERCRGAARLRSLTAVSVSRGPLLGLICLLVSVGAPDVASAATFPTAACPVHGRIESNVAYSCSAEFTLRASNGYRVTVSADAEGQTDDVELDADGPDGDVQYRVPGKVTADRIQARFGDLGRVSVRFRPSGRLRDVRVPRKCMKERPAVVTSRLGSFVGTIRFHGELGFTQVSAHSAQGGTGDPLSNTPRKLQCEFHESAAERERELESVRLNGSPANANISFGASRLFGDLPVPSESHAPLPPEGDRYLFIVLASEKVGPMSILRSSAALGESTDFVFDPALTSATVTPPAPFVGSGDLLRQPDGRDNWTGSLAVPLPGLGTVSLTGGKATLETVASGLGRLEEELQSGRHST